MEQIFNVIAEIIFPSQRLEREYEEMVIGQKKVRLAMVRLNTVRNQSGFRR